MLIRIVGFAFSALTLYTLEREGLLAAIVFHWLRSLTMRYLTLLCSISFLFLIVVVLFMYV